MAIGELLGALEREAAAELAALDAAARADAARVLADAAAARERARADELARARDGARRAHDAALAHASRDARGAVLAARAGALERLHAAVAARLPELLAGPGGAAVLDRLAAALVDAAGDRARVRCLPALAAAVTARLADHPALTIEPDPDTRTGLTAERDGGRVHVDATLATLLDRLWPRLRLEATAAEAP